jgi:2,3-dihydroxybiphenyl 1,2-dioxygenase
VADEAALHTQAQHVDACGVSLQPLSGAECALRGIARGLRFQDPAGFRHELFHGLQAGAQAPRFGRAVAGFRTGELGLGHVVLHIPRADELRDWYTRVLGARLTDFTREPFGAWFLHFNPRHHSLALIEGGRGGLHHLMIEALSLDDVGQAWDLAQLEDGRVATTLGRHTNDFVTSFYARSPDDFLVELGWGGRTIDPQTWEACEMQHGPSLWGHERHWLPEEARARARAQRLEAARAGLRQPVQVLDGHFHQGSTPAQPWERPVAQRAVGDAS